MMVFKKTLSACNQGLDPEQSLMEELSHHGYEYPETQSSLMSCEVVGDMIEAKVDIEADPIDADSPYNPSARRMDFPVALLVSIDRRSGVTEVDERWYGDGAD